MESELRSRRAEKRRRQPWQAGVFTRIGAIVREYRLGEGFLRRLAAVEKEWEGRGAEELCRARLAAGGAAKSKRPLAAPLFFLATAAEYEVIQAILRLCDNPYLEYAQCPEEILLSGPLYRRRGDLSGEVLSRCHFAVLWQEGEAEGERG